MDTSFDLADLESRLRGHVVALARTPRVPGSREHRQAQEYVRRHLEQAGFIVTRVPVGGAAGAGVNVQAAPLPDTPGLPLLVVGAHYDSVPQSPAADDNASGVAALLELARWVQPRLTPASRGRLQLVAYDLEEYGLLGSDAHSEELRLAGTTFLGMVSLEMLGYTDSRPGSQQLPPHLVGHYPDVANFIGVVGNVASAGLLQEFAAGMKSVAGLPVEALAVPGQGELIPQTRLSDHSSFWDRGFPALMLTDTSFFRNPHYHQTTDTAETLDFPFLARVTAGVCAAVGRLLAV